MTAVVVAVEVGASSLIHTWATSLPFTVRADSVEYLSTLILHAANASASALPHLPTTTAHARRPRIVVGFAVEARSAYLDSIGASARLWLDLLGAAGSVLVCLVGDGWAVGARARQLVQELSQIDRTAPTAKLRCAFCGLRVNCSACAAIAKYRML